jgi:hypothetical protein
LLIAFSFVAQALLPASSFLLFYACGAQPPPAVLLFWLIADCFFFCGAGTLACVFFFAFLCLWSAAALGCDMGNLLWHSRPGCAFVLADC